jgi:hypothetical protein
VVPGSPLGKALKYVERRWFSLCVFVLDARIPIDNGEVERVIRPIGVGRHNWLFTGSDEVAVRLCIVASVCATCRKLKVDPLGVPARRLRRDRAWRQCQTPGSRLDAVGIGPRRRPRT